MAKQTIKCSVTTCKYNDVDEEMCELDEIKVEPSSCDDDCCTECEDTCCASFECNEDKVKDDE